MNELASLLDNQKDRPAYVRFVRTAVEDVAASKKQGKYVARDIDYAHVTPPYSKDIMIHKADTWFGILQQQVDSRRIPQEWLDHYKRQYESWKNGQELPLNGTPIKGWGVISPAQQEMLIRLTILTVEDLANINSDAQKYIGMGAVDLKNKAAAWLAQLNDRGPQTQKMAELQAENILLKKNQEDMQKTIATLQKQLDSLKVSQPTSAAGQEEATPSEPEVPEPGDEIEIADAPDDGPEVGEGKVSSEEI